MPGSLLMIPSVLAQTTLIERGVVHIEHGGQTGLRVEVLAPPIRAANSPGDRRIGGITEDEFFDVLGQRDQSLPGLLKSFIAKADTLNVYPEFKGGLNLKHGVPEGQPLNMGTIIKDGFVDTGPSTWFGRMASGQIYNEGLAEKIGGFVNMSKKGDETSVRTAAGKRPRLSDLLPKHEQAWLDCMEQYIQGNLASQSAVQGPNAGFD